MASRETITKLRLALLDFEKAVDQKEAEHIVLMACVNWENLLTKHKEELKPLTYSRLQARTARVLQSALGK